MGVLQEIEYYLAKLIKKLHLRAIKNCEIHKTAKVCAGSQLVNVKLGKYTDVGYDCIIIDTEIGSFCSLGANIIIGGASHTIDWVSTSPVFNENPDHLPKKFSKHSFDLSSKTIIGNDVWIGNNVLIKSNTTIGDGAVIGMGSVVTKSIPPYEIWAGNPAKFIKNRFNDERTSKILKSKWWDLEDEKIEKMAGSFNNVNEFLKQIEKE